MHRWSHGSRSVRMNSHLKFGYSTSASGTLRSTDRLVILGSGWASYTLAKYLSGVNASFTLISPRNHFVFTPLLPQSTTGVLDFRNVFEPINTIKAKYFRAKAKSVDFDNKIIHCHFWNEDSMSFQLNYDKLVIGVGAEVNTFNIPGVNKENVFFLKEIQDAQALHMRLISNLEMASLPGINPEKRKSLLTFVVVGGGPTGVEYAGELVDFFTNELKTHYPEISPSETSVYIIEAGNTILNAFDSKLVSNATRKMQDIGVQLRTGVGVKEVRKNQVVLSDQQVINTDLILWCTGVGPNQFTSGLDVEKTRGRILVDGYLRVKGKDGVYAFGDCAEIENYPLPPTAQVSDRQAHYLFRCLHYGHSEKFSYKSLGKLTYIGAKYAICDTPWYKSGGFIEYVFWHFAYLLSFKSIRVLFFVPYNWIKTIFFGREVSTMK